MLKRLVWSSLAAVTLACSDSLGPDMTGRWVSPSAELVMTPLIHRFTVAGYRPVPLPRDVRFDSTGNISFAGNLVNSSASYPFGFSGTLVDDTIVATMSISFQAGAVTWNLVMHRDGTHLSIV